jgi:hypothetical protein
MLSFEEWVYETYPLLTEKTKRAGIAHWAYPQGVARAHYPASYFTPVAADAIHKLGPTVDDSTIDVKNFNYSQFGQTEE